MYIVIVILAGIIILQFIIMWKYQRQMKDICRQLAFMMKHDSNMLINHEFDVGGIGKLSDKLNELLELRRKEKQHYQEKEALIAEAEGQAARFNSLYQEYIKFPLITKQRMFYETMEEVLPSMKIYITDGSTQTLLPLEAFSTYSTGEEE